MLDGQHGCSAADIVCALLQNKYCGSFEVISLLLIAFATVFLTLSLQEAVP